MANRRISEFPLIAGADINEQDLLTLVHVFEVDPALRNKSFTFIELKSYLDLYYLNGSPGGFTGNVTLNGNANISGLINLVDSSDIQVGTGAGTKIGTSTTQKIGFYNTIPITQPAAVANATDLASAISQLNVLLGRMRNLGLIAV